MQEILELQRLAFFEAGVRYNDPDTPPLTETLDDLIRDSEGHLFLKAVIGGRIAGTARGRDEGGCCRISKVMVHPDHRDKGIGKRLVEAIEKEFDVPVFRLRTGYLDEKNISFYEKLGYNITGEPEKITDTLWFVHMVKKMPPRP